MVNCIHWSACQVRGGGCCAIDKFNGRPSLGVCNRVCQDREARPDYVPPPQTAVVANVVVKTTEAKKKDCGCGRAKRAK